MTAVIICSCIAILSIIGLIGWFFNSIEEAQKRIDDRDE